jgi:hypothetical protein
MEGNVMTLEDLGDEIMVLEGASIDGFAKGFFWPDDTAGKVILLSFGASSATAVFSERYRKPALVVAALTGIMHVLRTALSPPT